ncbi:AT hook-like protein [Ascosphaera apis ARSEF 7405]|uniref:AT hook-like protein n=1 Tax=Ascosphaera apis ARSEF 7405 TaxID=392613 RepID=A0A167XGG8_9EURO|nr:AT hook-like protein [Ascosphaera apis ARSEF 7405]
MAPETPFEGRQTRSRGRPRKTADASPESGETATTPTTNTTTVADITATADSTSATANSENDAQSQRKGRGRPRKRPLEDTSIVDSPSAVSSTRAKRGRKAAAAAAADDDATIPPPAVENTAEKQDATAESTEVPAKKGRGRPKKDSVNEGKAAAAKAKATEKAKADKEKEKEKLKKQKEKEREKLKKQKEKEKEKEKKAKEREKAKKLREKEKEKEKKLKEKEKAKLQRQRQREKDMRDKARERNKKLKAKERQEERIRRAAGLFNSDSPEPAESGRMFGQDKGRTLHVNADEDVSDSAIERALTALNRSNKRKNKKGSTRADVDDGDDEWATEDEAENLGMNLPQETMIGQYKLSCEEVQDQWPDDAKNMKLAIMRNKAVDSAGTGFIASFHLGIVEGTMILAGSVEAAQKIRNQISSDALVPIKRPSFDIDGERPEDYEPRHNRLFFRWRGRETGEGSISTDNYYDKNNGYIDFIIPEEASSEPVKIKGIIDDVEGIGGPLTFEGHKTKDTGGKKPMSWKSLGEDEVYDGPGMMVF